MAGNRKSGRKRLPVELHIARGTYRADRHGPVPAQSTGAADGSLLAPSWLSPTALELWDLVEGRLGNAVQVTDSANLAILCEAWALLSSSLLAAQKNPLDADARNAVVAYARLFDVQAGKFGLSPADRASLRASLPEVASDRRMASRARRTAT